MATDRETWIHHALIAMGMLPLFVLGLVVLPRWAMPAAFASGYYLFREIDQAIQGGTPPDRVADRILDVLAPGLWTLLVSGLFWSGGVRW